MPRTEAASQRIRDQRRTAILRAAVQVFARKGLAATKIADIAAAAGMSHGLVYHYFSSKEDVFRMVVERALAGSVQVVEDAENQPGTPWQRLTWYTGEVLSGLRDEPEYLMVVLQAFTSETVPPELREHAQCEGMASYERLTRLIAAGQAAGEVRAGEPERLAAIFLTFISGLSINAMTRDPILTELLDIETVLGILRAP